MNRNLLFPLLCLLLLLAGHAEPDARPRQLPFDPRCPAVHDPVMALGEDGRFYVFSTGPGINILSSSDLKVWRREKPAFPRREPQWAIDSVKGFNGYIWAPDICRHDGKWWLYYSCSTFGKNNSAIGVMTNVTLDPSSPLYHWEDHGQVIASHAGRNDWNAIDPNIVTDSLTGGRYLVFGSFWDGIQLVPVNAEGKVKSDEGNAAPPITIARRIPPRDTEPENAIEAPFIVHAAGYYWLFVSWDYCCRGRYSSYKTVYGRSRTVTGPYFDMSGKEMTKGGGTFLIGPDADFFGIGHCAVYPALDADNEWIFLAHAYDVNKEGQARLLIRRITFTEEGVRFLDEKEGNGGKDDAE